MSLQPNEFVSCPFNSLHRVLKTHLQHHIIKCKENYPTYVPCMYNFLHWFESKEKMLEHAKSCPSQRLVIERSYSNSVSVTSNNFFESRKFHTEEENWDEEYL